MTDTAAPIDYSKTLSLPETAFPMRAGLPAKEPEIAARWKQMDLYKKLRASAAGREKFVLHDGPPYANGNIHIGHALNKVLKDVITRSFQMRGRDANYVPGWDCHGLPIEWKIEEAYRARGKDKNEVPINEFRRECRDFAQGWIDTQSEEFRRLGIEGDFERPYTTMNFHSEARIAGELLKLAASGQLYRGSKPIMWSVVERTALAEAEVEYHEIESDTIWVKFPVRNIELWTEDQQDLRDASVVIWTTTPWTIPGNRAISYSSRIEYGLYEVTAAVNDFGPQSGEKLIFADKLASEAFAKAKLEFTRLRGVRDDQLAAITCAHPLAYMGYDFAVPLLDGDHVTDDAGTGFVHTAPSHGREDFEAWMSNARDLEARGISSKIPFTVGDDGFYTDEAPGFGPSTEGGAARVMDDNGKKGDANKRVMDALIAAGNLFARGRIKHEYPHSWRSKKPIIFRNTPQWFVYMDKDLGGSLLSPLEGEMSPKVTEGGKASAQSDVAVPPSVGRADISPSRGENNVGQPDTLRNRALKAIDDTRFVPAAGQNRLRAMIEGRPDWVLSRQRAWGVPICIFADAAGNVLQDDDVNTRILEAFEKEGADAWFASGAKERFLGNGHDADKWQMVTDILDVWFDSGCTHTFTLEDRPDLKWPADVYLEGSDQHRGWFHSSLLESCATRGRAPYDAVVTHGFIMDEKGEKMSKSKGNVTAPQTIMNDAGADILRLWVMSSDYAEDLRVGKTIIQTNIDAYRKIRNTIRWMLGTLAHDKGDEVAYAELPELEKLMLHRLAELDLLVCKAYDDFDFKRITRALTDFANVELSAFYFDIRKDTLYCDAPSSLKRRASLFVIRKLFDCLVLWFAPMMPFTTEEAWLSRDPSAVSVHLEQFPQIPSDWLNEAVAERWKAIRTVRRAVTGALEIERKEKRIGSSLEAAPLVYVGTELASALEGVDADEIFITSGAVIETGAPAEGVVAFTDETVSVVARLAADLGLRKCARSWRYTADIGSDAAFPDVSARDAAALRELGFGA